MEYPKEGIFYIKHFIMIQNPYAEEAKHRWGDTDAYKQSVERVQKMTQEDMGRIRAEGEALMREMAAAMPLGPTSDTVQKLIQRHYESLRNFYDPTPELYRGLGEMYVSDPRFKAHYEEYAKGMAEFLRDAMGYFCDNAAG